jgi:hypothetical protein
LAYHHAQQGVFHQQLLSPSRAARHPGGCPVDDRSRQAIETIDAALPDSRIGALPGQQHVAMDTVPELFLQEVMASPECRCSDERVRERY